MEEVSSVSSQRKGCWVFFSFSKTGKSLQNKGLSDFSEAWQPAAY